MYFIEFVTLRNFITLTE